MIGLFVRPQTQRERNVVRFSAAVSGEAVRVKGGMSLRKGMWHGLRNDIIMRNLKYAAE